jgi:hypothetical protein
MMAWADFVMHGNTAVLSDERRALLPQEHVDTLYQAGTQFYGYGLFVERGYLARDGSWYETPVWQHGGNTLSFTNILYMLPEHDFALATCSSGYGTDFTQSQDAAITTLVDLPEPSAGPEFEIDPAQFDRHVGTYTDEWNVGDMVITRAGGTLGIEMPLLESLGYRVGSALTPITSDLFYMTIDGSFLDLTFIPTEAGGQSVYVRNRSFVTTRVPDGKARDARRTPSADDVARWWARARLEPAPFAPRLPRP